MKTARIAMAVLLTTCLLAGCSGIEQSKSTGPFATVQQLKQGADTGISYIRLKTLVDQLDSELTRTAASLSGKKEKALYGTVPEGRASLPRQPERVDTSPGGAGGARPGRDQGAHAGKNEEPLVPGLS